MQVMKQVQKGFTLIELMIVVAIIGILAAVALPAYQNYMTKARISEAFATVDANKAAVVAAYAETSTWPDASIAPGVPGNAQYVAGLTYNPGAAAADGSIVAEIKGTKSAADGLFVGVHGTGKADGTIQWTCSTFTAANTVAGGAVKALYPYIPAACQS